jgi:hypothetical protein
MDSIKNQQNNEKKYIAILIDYFPSVIILIILSYVNKYNLQFIESSEFYTYDFLKELLYKKIPLSIHKTISFCGVEDIINEKIILTKDSSYERYKMFDVETLQVIKEFYCDEKIGSYCASDGKYIIFRKFPTINIVDINDMKIINTLRPLHSATYETMIVNNIVYLTANSSKRISKYALSGEHIDDIWLEKELINRAWCLVHIKITNNEIIMIDCPRVLFYDLNGNKLGESLTNESEINLPIVTSDFICFRSDGRIYKYKRVL